MAGLFGDDDPAPPPAFAGAPLFGEEPAAPAAAAAYRVLARKYRPQRFDDLIGQDALVRTLRNAFKMNRLAHAFMLTGVRGVGKTTTARILARAVNCTGPDGSGGPTPDPCGVCDNCVAILADRHPDVLEMDAASNTGIDDVREIIEATRFRPLVARIKFFIIDEVHMLSRQAFNALLKTLEEPPPHIKFVLATTEIRKVPVTVLSRCQRFDLRRVAAGELTAHFARIAVAEQVRVAPAALELIARAADGSVRDGLSLLDQAIALGAESGGAEDGSDEIGGPLVADMLGLADRGHVFDLMDAVVAGDAAAALAITEAAHQRGGDAGVLLGDLLGLAHLLTRLRAAPALAEGQALPEAERVRGLGLAQSLSVPWLGRMWQMLLKGVQEVEAAPDRRAAAEMICIRLCHVADMPPPGELIKRLSNTSNASAPPPPSGPPGSGVRAVANGAPRAAAAPELVAPTSEPRSFAEVVELAHSRREVMLYAQLRHFAHPVRFAPPVIELRLQPDAPRDLARRLAALLESETGRRWTIALVNLAGEPTLEEAEREAESTARADAAAHPLVREILRLFPGARLESNGVVAQPAAPVLQDAPLALPPDWDEAPPPEDELIAEED